MSEKADLVTLAALIEALGDERPEARRDAIYAVCAWPQKDEAAKALVLALAEPDNVGRRNAALQATIELGPCAVPPLLLALQGQPFHRKVLIDALGAIAADADAQTAQIALSPLRDALGDEDPNVRAAAVEGLGRISAEEALPILLCALRDDPDLVVRLGALSGLNQKRATLSLAVLTPLLNHVVLRPAALLALGRSGDEAALPFLVEGLMDRARGAREGAMIGLWDLREKVSIEAALLALPEGVLHSLIRALLEAHPKARCAAAALLPLLGRPQVVRPLWLALLGKDPEVSEVAAKSLQNLGSTALAGLDAALLERLDEARLRQAQAVSVLGAALIEKALATAKAAPAT